MDAMESATTPNGDGGSPPAQKRQRAKQACEPCRLRKRKCDGNMPCNMCTQFEYKCYFEKHPRKRSKLVEQHAQADLEGTEPAGFGGSVTKPSLEDITKMRSMEANSGIAFTRLLGQRLDPSSGPKLFTFGWNLGNSSFIPPTSRPVTDFLDQEQMYALARLHFANVAPLYGFLDKDRILQAISLRWSRPDACDVPDHLLCGLAAVGSLFSETGALPHPVVSSLVDVQKLALESTSTMLPPSLADVQSWILRCIYLRATDHPHSTWIASCTTMHLVEAVGLQCEASSSVLHPAANDAKNDPEIRRRCFWVARMLNTWVSFEYGRTRVALRGITAQLPTSKEGDYTTDYINLYSISCCLDPETSDKAGQWEEFLERLDAYECRHDGIALSKANLGLCGYRRLRLANPNLSGDITNRIINMGLRGLDAARRMAEKHMPWWHVANVPFQVICIFLAMDARESLSHLATAMRTLEFVVERFRTAAMKEALKTARFLVRLSKKRKDEDSEVLGLSLKKALEAADADPQPENLKVVPPQPTPNGVAPMPTATETPMTSSSNEDWNLDVLNDTQFDWNYFLTHDMPAFNSFAPDGTM
ncbi:related to Pdr3p [Lecanosticta acicola]|uniref:Related to Pdr3p n=1 Tax=Lecanosticta acicola TaxID=111012 RepID=A0AAI9EFQ6_9PEZI|nr:related to Pdr3p [Lecanosticta acicola]